MLSAQDARDEMFKCIINRIDEHVKSATRLLHTKTSPISLSRDEATNRRVVNHLRSFNFTVECWKNRSNVIIVGW